MATTKERGHCQICNGAYILSTRGHTGILAHHGFKRPKHQWQTASCRGARELPYEVSCDLLIAEVEHIKGWLAAERIWLKEKTATPPETLTIQWRGYGGKTDPSKDFTVTRPAQMQIDDRPVWQFGSENDRKYMAQYRGMLVESENRIRATEHHLVWQEKRLAEWKAPDAAHDLTGVDAD